MTGNTSPLKIQTSCIDMKFENNGPIYCFTADINNLSDQTQKWRLSIQDEESKIVCYLEEDLDKPSNRIRKWRFDEQQSASKMMATEDNKITIELYGSPIETFD